MTSLLLELPEELLLATLSYTSARGMVSCTRVCRTMSRLVRGFDLSTGWTGAVKTYISPHNAVSMQLLRRVGSLRPRRVDEWPTEVVTTPDEWRAWYERKGLEGDLRLLRWHDDYSLPVYYACKLAVLLRYVVARGHDQAHEEHEEMPLLEFIAEWREFLDDLVTTAFEWTTASSALDEISASSALDETKRHVADALPHMVDESIRISFEASDQFRGTVIELRMLGDAGVVEPLLGFGELAGTACYWMLSDLFYDVISASSTPSSSTTDHSNTYYSGYYSGYYGDEARRVPLPPQTLTFEGEPILLLEFVRSFPHSLNRCIIPMVDRLLEVYPAASELPDFDDALSFVEEHAREYDDELLPVAETLRQHRTATASRPGSPFVLSL